MFFLLKVFCLDFSHFACHLLSTDFMSIIRMTSTIRKAFPPRKIVCSYLYIIDRFDIQVKQNKRNKRAGKIPEEEFLCVGINNSVAAAYNNDVETITVTQSGSSSPYMSYLYGKMTDRFSFLPADCGLENDGDRTTMVFRSEKKYCPYIRNYTEENIADVIAVGYKYHFFDKLLSLPLLDAEKRDILITALVAADYPEDREYIRRRIRGLGEYCIDGVFNFRLRELKSRWNGIAEYIPAEFASSSLQSFLEFLIGESAGKVFLKEGKLYDEEYRVLNRSALIGRASPVREVILSGADNIYCFGAPDPVTLEFLKKYYKEKVVFC